MKTEKQTRIELIDINLALAGWNVSDPSQVVQELDIYIKSEGQPAAAEPGNPYEGHRFADYALIIDGKPRAVIEAKKTSEHPAKGQEQALQYAQDLQVIHGGPIPFIFYTNGYDTYFWESDFYPPIKVYGFPTKAELEWLEQRRETRKPLSVELIDTSIAGRDYQIAAIRTIMERVEAKQRRFLLVMATGTGKTRTAVGLVDVLKRARWANRVLFLVDRIALRDQAFDAFKEHMPSEPRWPEQGDRVFYKDRRIYISTYPTMLNIMQNGTTPGEWISPHFFDLIIADESHRSIYNTYKQILDYFHGIKIGLTATPKDQIDFDTFKLFECDVNDPTFAYTYEEAVEHDPPYLCDFDVLKVRSRFQLEGIKGEKLPPVVQKKLIEEGLDIDEIDFEGSELERKVTNSGTNALIVREFMEESIKDPSGTLPGKSIIFAISKAHARRIQELFDKLYPEHKGRLARVVVSDDRYVYGKGGLLDQFKHSDMPRVAISVDMLDTGVDIREIVNLVFAKPVFTPVKFWQMIGRGTRVLEDDRKKRKTWCPDKDGFLIIDCWENFERFDMDPRGREPGAQIPLPVRLFVKRLDKLEAAISLERADVIERVIVDLKADLATLPKNNVIVADKAANLATVGENSFWERLDHEDMTFLRQVIAPVLRARSGEDFKAMRFETEVVELGTAMLTENVDAFAAIKESVLAQVAELRLSVNIVAREKELIEEVQQPSWWSAPSEDNFQSLVDRLAPLMKYREKRSSTMVYLDIEDALQVKETVEFGPEKERTSTKAYRERVEAYIRALVIENPVLQKIQRGADVTDGEIMELAEILRGQDPYVTEELLRKVYDHKTARFIQFIRHILGLEMLGSWPETVTRAFDEFISSHTDFTSLQIRFLMTLKTFLTQTGKIEKKNLIKAPFTQIHPKGIRGIFSPTEIEEIVRFADNLIA